MSAAGTKTYVVIRPNQDEREVSNVARVEFIAGQNRVTFYDSDGGPIASFEGQGIDFHQK